MNMQGIFSQIDTLAPRYTDFLEEICLIEGTAYDKANIDRLIGFVEQFAQRAGLSCRRTPFAACGDFLSVEINAGAEKGGVMLAHTDTVHTVGSFGTPAVRREGNRMIGPGTVDCKGGIAVALLALKALLDNGYPRHARLLLTSDEEISNVLGGKEEQEFFRREVSGFPCALNCETTEGNDIVVARRGVLHYELTVKGKGGHAGIHYFSCKNPLQEAAHKIIELEKLSREGGMTFSCNVIEAGSRMNVIPDACTFSVDVRVSSRAQVAEADALVREIAAHSYIGDTETEVKDLGARPPMEKTKEGDALFSRLLATSRRYGFGELTPVESGGGSDSAYTQAVGVPSLCGFGAPGGKCHTKEEFVEISAIPLRAKLLAAFLSGEAERKGEER